VAVNWGVEFNSTKNERVFIQIKPYHRSYYTLHEVAKDDNIYELGPLDPATTYEWRVAVSVDLWEDHWLIGESFQSEPRLLITADVLWEPGHIHTPMPDSGATLIGVNPSFAWEVYNPDLMPYDFDIYLGTTTDPPLLVSELGVPGYDLLSETLDYGTLYYWHVEAYYDTDTIEGPLWEFTTIGISDLNVFALFEIDAQQIPSGYHIMEEMRVRFDAELAQDIPIDPIQADSVFIGGTKLNWNTGTQNYSYTEWSFPFIENGQLADIIVYGNTDVPDLNTNVVFPACTLSITSPETFGTVSINGFELTWDGTECGGTVWLTILDGTDSTGVWVETENDGSYTLTAGDLVPLDGQTGTYNLAIIKLVEENITSPGYRSESIVRSRAFNSVEQVHIYDIK
jgi:hypothetical protein